MTFDDEWDAGNLGCGALLFELKFRLQPLSPGRLLKLTAIDSGAVEDIPAWCRLAGHSLVSAEHPVYVIRRGEK